MRTGHLGRREAHIPRFIDGSLSGPSRSAVSGPPDGEHADGCHARPPRLRCLTRHPSSASPPLNLAGALPINLREFLAVEFAADGLHIDEDGVFTLDHGAGEDALSRVARAIRRFSTRRAHERWEECATALDHLAEDLDRAAASGEQVALCLGCAALETGVDAVARHRGSGCVAVDLSARTSCRLAPMAGAGLPELLRHVIEGFRLARAALGLAHYDLDCYLARGQVIFTWRPVKPAS